MPHKAVVSALKFFGREREMASSSGTLRGRSISLEEAVRIIESQESGTKGLTSDEESDLDQQLYDMVENLSDDDAASGDYNDGADIQSVVLPIPATPAPLATAAFVAAPASPLAADVNAILTAATPAATPARFYGQVPPPARSGSYMSNGLAQC
ncbi:PREDICTED: uncharacterized protein LOC107356295 isoform X2 [Acropora digitifera]|uniref:uncharacterized protein LOC107356295 isoform X2 n=1 Tax=Acropora digitifera TaxID=70779 RepID=UPI00077AAFE1|nr:PREDICTED: uncharacterized protein LOC107356295 isoform X2 [Acropora digitifera]